jgi:uncharacterized glyoxalase superfamily protein PhnB
MRPTPAGWPRASQSVYYRDPKAAIDWLGRAFGFEVRMIVDDDRGRIVHSDVTFAEALFLIGGSGHSDPGKEAWQTLARSPAQLDGACTQAVCLFVDDVDAHCATARAAGATIVREPTTNDYGDDYWTDRSYGCKDLEGHLWWFMQRLRSGKKG